MKRFTLPLLLILLVFSNNNSLTAQVKAESMGCKEEGYKQAYFQKHFIYTGTSVSPYTQQVDIIDLVPLAYFKPIKMTKRSQWGQRQKIKTKGEIRRLKVKHPITIVTDTIAEKNFRTAYFILDKEYKTKVVDVTCGYAESNALSKRIAESLTEKNYYSGNIESSMHGELWNALMKFQADQSLMIGPISQKTVDALGISQEEINQLIDRENELKAIDEHQTKFMDQVTPLLSQQVEEELYSADLKRFYENCIEKALPYISTEDTIYLKNASFEDIPRVGGRSVTKQSINGWYDCGSVVFPRESPPDIHPTPDQAWGVNNEAVHGCTYLGLVIRDNEAWESVSQELAYPLEANSCYSFSLQLAQSEDYISASRKTGKIENFRNPTRIQIWGGNEPCHFQELLAESTAINNNEWQSFDFEIKPKESTQIFSIRAFYEDWTIEITNGHILVDDLSPFVKISCN